MKSLRETITAVLCLMLLSSIADAAADTDELLGIYWLPEKDGQIEVYEKDGRYFGRITSYDVEGQKDEKNPDKTLRNRPVLGIDLLANFGLNLKSGRWEDGTIYDAKSGKTYRCYLWFEDGDKSVLWARGFIGFALLGRTERFERFTASKD